MKSSVGKGKLIYTGRHTPNFTCFKWWPERFWSYYRQSFEKREAQCSGPEAHYRWSCDVHVLACTGEPCVWWLQSLLLLIVDNGIYNDILVV